MLSHVHLRLKHSPRAHVHTIRRQARRSATHLKWSARCSQASTRAPRPSPNTIQSSPAFVTRCFQPAQPRADSKSTPHYSVLSFPNAGPGTALAVTPRSVAFHQSRGNLVSARHCTDVAAASWPIAHSPHLLDLRGIRSEGAAAAMSLL